MTVSVKSLQKQLIAAVAMVLVAMIALGSSTYAWFAQNNTVKATTSEINAVSSDPFLYIAYGSGVNKDDTGSWKTADNSTALAGQVKPVTSADGVHFGQLGSGVAVYNLDSSVATWSGTAGAFQDGDIVDATDGGGSTPYKIDSIFSVLNKNASAATNLYVKSITVNYADTSGKDMSKAVRVAVTMGSTTLIFNPNSGTNNDGKVGSYTGSAWELAAPTYVTPNTGAASLGSLAADTSTTVTVTLWFEGQDNTVFTNNIDPDKLTVSVELTTVTPA